MSGSDSRIPSSLTVNGTEVSVDVSPRELLVDALRDQLELTGTKVGCETGECGACTVLLDGKAVKSCLVLAASAGGSQITTVEGLAEEGELSPIQEGFWEEYATQDGFSTPGVMMSVADLLSRNPDPTSAEIRAWLDGNLCRVTGYHNLVRAVHAAASRLKGDQSASQQEDREDDGKLIGAPACPPPKPHTRHASKARPSSSPTSRSPGMVYASILRSPHGHARITSIDTSAASSAPGVIRVFTGPDVAQIMPLPVIWVPTDIESHFPPHPSGIVPGSMTVLATDRVRFAGDAVAVVVADTRQQADDALKLIAVEYEVLPAVTEVQAALAEGAPQLHEAVPGNLVFNATIGDRDAADAAIADADVVVRKTIRNQRLIANTIESRGDVAEYDATTGDFTLYTNIQPLYPVRLLTALYVLGVPYNKVRIIAPAIGSSLGSKGYIFADGPLMLWIARELGQPDQVDSTPAPATARSTPHGRDHIADAVLAGTQDGHIQALSVKSYSNLGAYPVINAPGTPRTLFGRSITGAYDIEHPFFEVDSALTNTVQVGPIRGSGRSEAMFVIERMVDMYAREIGMDPSEVRRRNLVRADQMPFENRLGWVYDSGDYVAGLDRALELVGYGDLDSRREEAQTRGKRLGVGIGSYVAVAGVGPSAKMGEQGLVSGTRGSAHMAVEPSGEVVVTTGAQPHGQSQETTFAQIAADELGIPMEIVKIRHSDTAGSLYYGQASYGSRSLSVEGVAVQIAAQKIKDKARAHAAHLFNCDVEAVVYGDGKVYATFAPDQAVMTLQQVAFTLWLAWDLAPGMDPGLEARSFFDPPEFNYPFGTHVAVVEVDEETGQVDLVRYVAVDDFGTVVNPGVVDGQTHGNIGLGVGQALLEEVVYDEDGALLTDSYSTYPLIRATQLPDFELERTETPTPNNPLGAKGAGDVSNPAVAPAVVNAVCNALEIDHIDMPLRLDRGVARDDHREAAPA